MNNLRVHLLSNILSSEYNFNKYSISLNNVSAVISLEKEETKNPLPNSLFKEYDEILSLSNNLLSSDKKVPLLILEQYYSRNSANLNKELYIEYNNSNFEVKVSELYVLLEEFFMKIYILAVKISDYYNLEIKLKTNKDEEQKYL